MGKSAPGIKYKAALSVAYGAGLRLCLAPHDHEPAPGRCCFDRRALTFPFNLLVGIPTYIAVARWAA